MQHIRDPCVGARSSTCSGHAVPSGSRSPICPASEVPELGACRYPMVLQVALDPWVQTGKSTTRSAQATVGA